MSNTRCNAWIAILCGIIFVRCGDEYTISLQCCTDITKKIICLQTTDTILYADGVSFTRLIACIPDSADKSITSITFTAPPEAGSFVLDGGTNTVTRTLDQTRQAEVLFTPSTNDGTYRIVAKVEADGRSYEDDVIIKTIPNDNSIITIDGLEQLTDIRADGASVYRIEVKVAHVDIEGKSLTVSKAGPVSFFEDPASETLSLGLSETGRASFSIIPQTMPGPASLGISVDNQTCSEDFIVRPAYPENIQMIASKNTLAAGSDSVGIDIYLFRNSGQVSSGILLHTQAYQIINPDTIQVGSFIPPFTITAAGAPGVPAANVLFVLNAQNQGAKESTIYIETASINDSGERVSSRLTFLRE